MWQRSASFDGRVILFASLISCCSCSALRANTPSTQARANQQFATTAPAFQVPSDGIAIVHETIKTAENQFAGSTAYFTIDAPASAVVSVLESDNAFWHLLPRIWDFRVISGDADDKLVEIEQGTQLVRGRYTMRIVRQWNEKDGSCTVGFVIDQRFPSPIPSAYGLFQVRPLGPKQSSLTYQIRIDLGNGLLKAFFEERIMKAAISPPERLRRLMDSMFDASVTEPNRTTQGN